MKKGDLGGFKKPPSGMNLWQTLYMIPGIIAAKGAGPMGALTAGKNLVPWVTGASARANKMTGDPDGARPARISGCCTYLGPVTGLLPLRPFPSFNFETFIFVLPIDSISQHEHIQRSDRNNTSHLHRPHHVVLFVPQDVAMPHVLMAEVGHDVNRRS